MGASRDVRRMPALDSEFLTTVIAQHGLWKYRLHRAIESGTSEFRPELIAMDDRCALGTWLYAGEQEAWRGTPEYEHVRARCTRTFIASLRRCSVPRWPATTPPPVSW